MLGLFYFIVLVAQCTIFNTVAYVPWENWAIWQTLFCSVIKLCPYDKQISFAVLSPIDFHWHACLHVSVYICMSLCVCACVLLDHWLSQVTSSVVQPMSHWLMRVCGFTNGPMLIWHALCSLSSWSWPMLILHALYSLSLWRASIYLFEICSITFIKWVESGTASCKCKITLRAIDPQWAWPFQWP